jgi:tetratricopeptide (TPR) repeat protein
MRAKPVDPADLMLMANVYGAEANYYRMNLQYEEALPLAKKALALREQAAPLMKNDTVVLRSLMSSYNAIGDLYRPTPGSQVQPAEALQNYEQGVEIAERLSLADPADKTARYTLALNLIRLAGLYMKRDELEPAIKHAERSLALFKRLGPELEQNLEWRGARAGTLLVYGEICERSGKPAAVEPAVKEALAEALAIAKRAPRPEHWLRTASIASLRMAKWLATRDPDSALRYSEQSVSLARQAAALPGSIPFSLKQVAESKGETALLLSMLARQRSDAALQTKARDLARESVADMAKLADTQLADWSEKQRDLVRELASVSKK